MNFVTKIYLKWLWYSRTCSFQWAHKPLCRHFKADIITLGHIHLCRSCCCLYAGILSGLCLRWWFPEWNENYAVAGLMALSLFVVPLSRPDLYKKMPRFIRDVLRFSLGIMVSQTVLMLFTHHVLFALPLLILLLIFRRCYYKQRYRRKLKYCKSCEDYAEGKICPGFAKQAALIRQYEEEATDYLLKTGYVPACLSRKG